MYIAYVKSKFIESLDLQKSRSCTTLLILKFLLGKPFDNQMSELETDIRGMTLYALLLNPVKSLYKLFFRLCFYIL